MMVADTIVLAHEGSRSFNAYLARPAGTAPSIIIFTEMFGMGRTIATWPTIMRSAASTPWSRTCIWRSAFPGELAFEGPDRDAAWARLARPRRRCRRPRYRHGGRMAARAAVFERQGVRARLLRRRPHGLRRRGAGRRRCRGVVLRHGHRQACCGIAQRDLSGATALRPQGPAHSAAGNRRGDAGGAAAAQHRNFSLSRTPATRSSIRSGPATTPPRRSLPADGSMR